MAASAVITANSLTKAYDSHVVVDELDLSVYPGEVFGLLGPNGAGKTTTILMLLGLTEPTAGEARVAGLDPTRDPLRVKRMVGYLPDSVGFYDDLTGKQNLRYTARLNRLPQDATEDRISELLDEVGLSYAADQRVGTYSRGMLQRLGIADALIKDPVVMMLDEPTIAIDPEGVVEIQRLIRGLADERQVTVLLSSHLLHQMQSICDRVAIFVDGKIIAQGTAHDLAAELSQGHSTFELDVEGSDDVAAVLAGIEEVGMIDPDPIVAGRWRVSLPTDSARLITEALVASGVSVLQLRRMGEDLDEIYRRYFEDEEEEEQA